MRKCIKILRTANIVLAVAVCTMLFGCGDKAEKDSKNMTVFDDGDTQGEETTIEDIIDDYFYGSGESSYECTEDEGDEIVFDTDRDLVITFAGNSLLGEPKVYRYFDELVERYHLNVSDVYYEIFYGQSLHYQVSLIDAPEFDFVKDDYGESDIIIFQEYGGAYDLTCEDITTLLDSYCKEGAVAYYYTTQFDYYGDYIEELSKDERIHIIDFGKIFSELEFMDQRGEYLYQADYHPNELAGFMAAAYIYTQLYKTEFTGYGYDELSDTIRELLPGENDDEKEAFYQQMIEVINHGVNGLNQ